MAKIGYARVSTKDQNLARQIEALEKYGCKKIFREKISGKNITDRLELQKMLDYIRDDDEVVVLSLDRLSRDNEDMDKIIHWIQDKGATFTALDMPSFNGIEDANMRKMLNNLVYEVFKYSAQNEREKIHERQAEGIAIAKREGKYKGAVQRYRADATDPHDRYIYNQIVAGIKNKTPKKRLAEDLGISRNTVIKLFKQMEVKGDEI